MSRTKSLEKRKAILDVSKSLFLSKGYAAVSMDLISKTSGISKNTLYSHFKNKAALFSAVIKSHWQNGSMPSIKLDSSLGLQETLTDFSFKLLRHLYKEDTMSFFRLLAYESHAFPKLSASIMDDKVSPSTSKLSQCFIKELNKNEKDAHALAIQFLGLLKEDAFWHVLVGFRNKYTKQEMQKHVETCVTTFMKFISIVDS